jgi:hypothetical protein
MSQDYKLSRNDSTVNPSCDKVVDEEGTDSNTYFVERIVKKKVENGIAKFLIKWQGYSLREATWEPLCNLVGSDACTSFYGSIELIRNSSHSLFYNCRRC